jgi:hypothetical protein
LSEREHFGDPGQEGVNGAPQIADAFAVDDSHLAQAALAAGRQVGRKQFLDVLGPKGVQVQDPVNRQWDRLVHT